MAASKTISPGDIVSVPHGYYPEDIQLNTPTLASLTSATAGATNIRQGKTAWVNGNKITGTNTGTDGAILLSGPSYLCAGTSYQIFVQNGYLYSTKSNTINTNITCDPNTNRLLIMVGTYNSSSVWDELRIIDTAWASSLGPYDLKQTLSVAGSGPSAVHCYYGPRIYIKSSKGGKFSVIVEGYAININYVNYILQNTIIPCVSVIQFKQ